MSLIEIIAVTFSLFCVVLSIRRSVWSWPVGQVGIAAYLVLFYREKLYADMVLQVVFIVQGFYGWYNWGESKKKDHLIIVSTMRVSERSIAVISILIFTFFWALALKTYTDASLPYVDAFAATTSFVATWLMARKKLESWIFWITADIVYVGLFWYKGLYLSCGIYSVFLALAIAGFFEWNKNLTTKLASR